MLRCAVYVTYEQFMSPFTRPTVCQLFLASLAGAYAASTDNHRPFLRDLRTEQLAAGSSLHVTKFGEAVTDEDCKARNTSADLEEIVSYKLPYAFSGPNKDCDTDGCGHGYWGRRCRFDGFHMPACPETDRWKITGWLFQQATHGAQWAKDVLTLKPCDLWAQIRGRTVWIVGDSISQDMAYGLSCFLVEYMTIAEREITRDPTTLRALTHSPSGHQLSSWCIGLAQNSRICSLRANKVPHMASTILQLLPSVANADDIVMLNFGTWYNAGAAGMAELETDVQQFEAAMVSLRASLPKRVLWRETSAQHFDSPSGMFDTSKSIPEQTCAPSGSRLGVKLEMRADGGLAKTSDSGDASDESELQVLLAGGHRNRITQPAIDRLGLPMLRLWNISLVVHDVHKSYHRQDSGGSCVSVDCDCSHACLPSWYEMILPDFLRLLRQWDKEEDVKSSHGQPEAI